jgi:hypothetical protein
MLRILLTKKINQNELSLIINFKYILKFTPFDDKG